MQNVPISMNPTDQNRDEYIYLFILITLENINNI